MMDLNKKDSISESLSMLDHALEYTKQGLKVFPCKLDKHPWIMNGFYAASTSTEQIREWWTTWQDASIGCPTGQENGFWVLDVDLPKKIGDPNGFDSLIEIEAQFGKLPETLTQITGSGGRQYFFKWTGQEIRNSAGKIGPGIDVRGNGGYVIIPPSNHPTGGQYQWLDNSLYTIHTLPEAPAWLIQMASKTLKPVPTNRVNAEEECPFFVRIICPLFVS